MAQTNINFRIDEELKKEMEIVCKEMGLTMSTAFTLFTKKVINEQRIPFEISIDPFYSRSNIKCLEQSINEMSKGKFVSKTFEELESMANE